MKGTNTYGKGGIVQIPPFQTIDLLRFFDSGVMIWTLNNLRTGIRIKGGFEYGREKI